MLHQSCAGEQAVVTRKVSVVPQMVGSLALLYFLDPLLLSKLLLSLGFCIAENPQFVFSLEKYFISSSITNYAT